MKRRQSRDGLRVRPAQRRCGPLRGPCVCRGPAAGVLLRAGHYHVLLCGPQRREPAGRLALGRLFGRRARWPPWPPSGSSSAGSGPNPCAGRPTCTTSRRAGWPSPARSACAADATACRVRAASVRAGGVWDRWRSSGGS
ncbi:unnamed protein product [Ixodes persulcatus]